MTETTTMTHEPTGAIAAPTVPPRRAGRVVRASFLTATVSLVVALLLAALFEDGMRRFFFAYLVNFAFFLSISLGGLFFVLIQHLTRAGWSVGMRRLAEVAAAVLPMIGIAFAPIAVSVLLGDGSLYPWSASGVHAAEGASGGDVGAHAMSPAKAAYLSPALFLVRWALYFAVWSVLAVFLWRRSTRQDSDGDVRHTLGMQRASAIGIVLYAITVTFAAIDLLMSLDPVWYSTIFGVYFFSGGVVGFLATLIVVASVLARSGVLGKAITVEHLHDLGKLLFAFVFFWGYIAFSQYMLIWYANLPETTFWLAERGLSTAEGGANGWSIVIVALLFGHFLLPFVGLMSRHVKRSRAALTAWAVWLLVFHWIDLWWLVFPELGATPRFGLLEITTLVGVGALFTAACARLVAGTRLVPVRDPRLGESLEFHNA